MISLRRLHEHTFFRFLVVGGVAALVNFSSRILLSNLMDYALAIVLAYLLGMVTAFTLNRAFVFEAADTGVVHQQFLWFTLVNVAAVAQTLAISLLLARVLLPTAGVTVHAETIAHAVGVIFPVFTSYLGHKRLSFRQPAA